MAGANGDDNGVPKEWHRWRGGIDEQVAGVREDVLVLRAWRQDLEKNLDAKGAVMHEKVNALSVRVARVETRVAVFAAAGGITAAIAIKLLELIWK